MKKTIESNISNREENYKILDWINKDKYHEGKVLDIEKQVTSDGRHKDYAQWFLDTTEYTAWCEALYNPKGDRKEISENSCTEMKEPPRVLWIKGFYGTGKTTIVYVELNIMQLGLTIWHSSCLIGLASIRKRAGNRATYPDHSVLLFRTR
jgi:hypothetical protein